jgi:hypothetical protein
MKSLKKRFPPEAKIDPGKRLRIFGLAAALGIAPRNSSKEDSHLYDLIEAHTGERSISGMTNAQADTVISDMERRLGNRAQKLPRSRTPEKYSSLARHDEGQAFRSIVTPDQMEIIDDLISKINASGRYRFTRENRAQYQFKTEFRRLTRGQAQAMIEGLKAILGRVQG